MGGTRSCGIFNRRHQQDSLWSWLVLFTATIGDALTFTMAYSYAVILPVLVKEFKQTRENIAWISSIAFCVAYLASPISTIACTRLGHRWTAALGALMCAVALVSSSFVSSVYWLFLTYGILFGIGGNFYHVPGILLVQIYFKKRRSLATGIFATSSSYSAMLGPIYKFLIDRFGWRQAFWISSLWFFVPLVLVLFLYSPNVGYHINNEDRHAGPTTRRHSKMTCSYWNPWFTIGVIAIGLQFLALLTPLSHMIKHANEVGYPDSKSSMMLIYIGITSLIGKVTAGRILDSPRTCVFWLNQISAIMMVVAIVILKFATNDVTFISFAVLYGFGNGSYMASMYVLWLTTVEPEYKAAGLATGEVLVALGSLVGSPFIGFLADRSQSYDVSFLVSATILFGATMILFLRFCFKKPNIGYNDRTARTLVDTLEEKDFKLLERETVL